jgi:cell division transport system permease protein
LTNGKHTSYFYAIFGITLVLFVLGVAAAFVLAAQKVSVGFKENLLIEVELRDSISNTRITSLENVIRARPYVKNVKFISKEEAAKILQKDLGENFLDVLGYNPLYASFNLNLNQQYANKDSFDIVKEELAKIPDVKQVKMQNNLLESLDKNVKSATLIILIIAVALFVFAVSLIFNTIRLVMFSNRFTIKTMQLFGATRWFIIRPFLGRSILNGFMSGLAASTLLTLLLFYFDQKLPDLGLQADLFTFALLLGAIILFGVLISFCSTLIAVFRYLGMRVEDLY